jgi:hypothetical protein
VCLEERLVVGADVPAYRCNCLQQRQDDGGAHGVGHSQPLQTVEAVRHQLGPHQSRSKGAGEGERVRYAAKKKASPVKRVLTGHDR